MVSLLVIPSFYLAFNLLEEKKFTQNVERFIQNEFADKGYTLIYKKTNFNQSPKKIELAFLSKKIDSIEIKNLNERLKNYQINGTQLDIRQNSSDLKDEILKELQTNNSLDAEKDVRIKQLIKQLEDQKVGDYKTVEEVKILFPTIQSISFGKTTQYITKDSMKDHLVVVYSSNASIDDKKLKDWLQSKFDRDSLFLIKN